MTASATTKPAGRILVVEDDPAVQKALRRLFETEGYSVETQSDGRSALDSFQSAAPAAIVLDLRLPKVSGRDVCKEIKALAPTVPIVVLSAASDVSDKVLLLELGADDYVTKPFSPRELLARVRAALRHNARTPDVQVVSFDGISADFKKMEIKQDGKVVVLTAQEFKTFQFLVQNATASSAATSCSTKSGAIKTILRPALSITTFLNSARNWREIRLAPYTSAQSMAWDISLFADTRESFSRTRAAFFSD